MPCNCRTSASRVRAACRRTPEAGFRLPALLLPLALLTCQATALAQTPHPLDAAAGKALFERQWVAAPASTAASDGLGPLYNARSCAACHPRAGSSPLVEHRVLRIDDPVYGKQLQTHALSGLQPEAQLLLHDLPAADPVVASAQAGLTQPDAQTDRLAYGSLTSGWSLRVPPDLRAVAAIASVSSKAIEARADPGDRDGDGISGRIARVPGSSGTELGRFGWKAETGTLEQQVALAFSLDLGLGSAWFPAAHGDCTRGQQDCLAGVDGSLTGSSEHELEPIVIELITTWLRTHEAAQLPQDDGGLVLFQDLGCSACHVPELDGQHLFSDLLLHDMGTGLADTLPLPHAAVGEWRTAPLAGLGSKQRFLHDGRAASVREAILWHAGEASAARAAWLALPAAAQEQLDTFLKRL